LYDELYRAWKQEKENVKLQFLPKNFFTKLSVYVKSLKEEQRMLDEKSMRARLLLTEYSHVIRLISELIQVRRVKILTEVLEGHSIPIEDCTSEEEEMHGTLASIIETYDGILKTVVEGREIKLKAGAEKPKRILVRFIQPLPAIVGIDMKSYGPFKPEDIVLLPTENAEALLKQKAVMGVDIEK
jgi:DNA replication initiation complex subunit (GINS family)